LWRVNAGDIPPPEPIDFSTLDSKIVYNDLFSYQPTGSYVPSPAVDAIPNDSLDSQPTGSSASLSMKPSELDPNAIHNDSLDSQPIGSSASLSIPPAVPKSESSPSTSIGPIEHLFSRVDDSIKQVQLSDNHSDLGSVQTSLFLTNEAGLTTGAKENGTRFEGPLNQKSERLEARRVGASDDLVAQAGKQAGPLTNQARVVAGMDNEDADADLEAYFISDPPSRDLGSSDVNN
jgi:hypothetical protein